LGSGNTLSSGEVPCVFIFFCTFFILSFSFLFRCFIWSKTQTLRGRKFHRINEIAVFFLSTLDWLENAYINEVLIGL